MHRTATNSRAYRRHEGFSLIELLVVIAIIGLLAGLLVPSVSAARTAAKIVKTQAFISTLDSALRMFKQETRLGRDYPPSYWSTASGPNHPGGDPYAPSSAGAYFGAHTVLWALAGADLSGTPGFDGDLSVLYGASPAARRYGPFVDVTKTPIENVEDSEFRNHDDFSKIQGTGTEDKPVFVDAFGMPVLYYKANPAPEDVLFDTFFVNDNRPFMEITTPKLHDKVRDVRAQNLGAERTYNQDSFLLISAGPDMEYAGQDMSGWMDNVANFPVNP